MLVIFILGCSKNDSSTPTPAPTPPAAPSLTVTATANIILYNASDTINFISDGMVTINGNAAVTSPVYLKNMVKDTTLTFSAVIKDASTGLTSTPTVKAVTIHVVSKGTTILIGATNGWMLTGFTREQYPLTGHPTTLIPSYEKDIYYLGDTCHVFTKSTAPNIYGLTEFYLADNDATYVFSQNNVFHIIQLDNNIFKIDFTVKSVNNPTDSFYHVKEYHRL